MKKIACTIGFTGVALAQVQFVSVLGSTDNGEGYSLVQTTDGGFAVAGWTYSFSAGGQDIILSRFDSLGNHLWTRVLGGTNNDWAYSLIQATGGGFAVAGYTGFGAGGFDMFLSRFDSDGNYLWTRTLGGTSSDYGRSLIQTTDTGFAMAGNTYSFGTGGDIIISRLDTAGNHLWTRILGGTGSERGNSLVQTTDGGFAVAGSTQSFGAGGVDMFLSRFGSDGSHLWTLVLGGAAGDYAPSLIQTTDGGFAVAGYTESFGAGGFDIFLSRFDPAGNHLWTRALGGTDDDYGHSLVQTTDGGFAVAGYTESFGAGGDDIILSRFDSLGNHLWTRVLGGASSDYGYSLVQTTDAGFAITGTTYSAGHYDIILAKYDPTGATCMGDFITPTVSSPSPTVSLITPTVGSPSPTVGSPAPTISSPTPNDTVLCFENVGEAETPAGSQVYLMAQGNRILFSVPAGTMARLSVYDAAGRLVARPVDGMAEADEREITLNELPGVYFVELRAGSRELRTKAVVR